MFDIFIKALEIIGTISFAISGAICAIRHKLDMFGVIIIGIITACGGGFIRDIILKINPISLLVNYKLPLIATIVSILTFIIFYILKDKVIIIKYWLKEIFVICDAIGLSIFSIIGADVAIKNGYTTCISIVFMATATALFGGVLRDVFVLEIPSILVKDFYAIPTIIGSIIYYLFIKYFNDRYLSVILVLAFVINIRLISYHFNLNLPKINYED